MNLYMVSTLSHNAQRTTHNVIEYGIGSMSTPLDGWVDTLADHDLAREIRNARARDAGLRPSGGNAPKLGDAMRRSSTHELDLAWRSVRKEILDQYKIDSCKEAYIVHRQGLTVPAKKYFRQMAKQEHMTLSIEGDKLTFAYKR